MNPEFLFRPAALKLLNLSLIFGLTAGNLILTGCNSSPTKPSEHTVSDPLAEIVIISPTGGEKIAAGSTFKIKWKLQGVGLDEVNAVNIELSPDSGKTWIGLLNKSIGTDSPSWGDYAWTVPADITHLGVSYPLTGNSKLLLKIMQYSTADKNKIVTTKKTFSIIAP